MNNISELEKKESEYRNYIERHCSNVWKVWVENRDSLFMIDSSISIDINKMNPQILAHDSSKYSPREFCAYRKNFYPVNDAEKKENEESFDLAWKHHYEDNPHHWNHWIGPDKIAKEMDDYSIVHMICDWMAMGIQFNDTATEYYEKNKELINLAPETRIKVESLLSKMG